MMSTYLKTLHSKHPDFWACLGFDLQDTDVEHESAVMLYAFMDWISRLDGYSFDLATTTNGYRAVVVGNHGNTGAITAEVPEEALLGALLEVLG